MKIYRQTTLFKLFPVEDFAFKKTGCTYTLRKREVDLRRDRYRLTLRKKEERKDTTRYFTYDQMISTFIFLKSCQEVSRQPKSSISLTYSDY